MKYIKTGATVKVWNGSAWVDAVVVSSYNYNTTRGYCIHVREGEHEYLAQARYVIQVSSEA